MRQSREAIENGTFTTFKNNFNQHYIQQP
jgi:queuine/archaeosine tRNA-ribosyltransferase